MDGFEEKKWFVYLSDHHEGPFSVAEIEKMLESERTAPSSFVWAEGMGDWKAMSDVAAFQAILSQPQQPAPDLLAAAEAISEEPVHDLAMESSPAMTISPVDDVAPAESMASPALASPAVAEQPAPQAAPARAASRGFGLGRLLKTTFLTCVLLLLPFVFFMGAMDPLFYPYPRLREVSQALSDLSRPLKIIVLEKAPVLGKWVSLLPRLEDVTPAEYEELKAAVSSRVESAGPRIAAALSTADSQNPAFYVASNLPEGTQFDVFVEGQPDTLLNHLSFSQKIPAVAQKGLAKTPGLKFPDGRLVPRGQYDIYVSLPGTESLSLPATPISTEKLPSSLPKNIRVLARKSYFLGGPKDAAYTARLKDFHDKIASKANDEIRELTQFLSTLESQLNQTAREFRPWVKPEPGAKPVKITPAQRKSWQEFHDHWLGLSVKLGESLSKWNTAPAATADPSQGAEMGYFYGPLFQLTMQAAQAVTRVHELENDVVHGKAASRDPLEEALALARSGVNGLRSKIAEASNAPRTSSGAPQVAPTTPEVSP